jgi:hypothetical protein
MVTLSQPMAVTCEPAPMAADRISLKEEPWRSQLLEPDEVDGRDGAGADGHGLGASGGGGAAEEGARGSEAGERSDGSDSDLHVSSLFRF